MSLHGNSPQNETIPPPPKFPDGFLPATASSSQPMEAQNNQNQPNKNTGQDSSTKVPTPAQLDDKNKAHMKKPNSSNQFQFSNPDREDPNFPPLPTGPNKRWIRKDKRGFQCLLCNITCNSRMNLQVHFIGKKHSANLHTSMGLNPPEPMPVAQIQKDFEVMSYKEPVLGLDHLIEFASSDRFFYNCTLCENGDLNDFSAKKHMVGQKHRINFMKTFCPQTLHKFQTTVEKNSNNGTPLSHYGCSQLLHDLAVEVSAFKNGHYVIEHCRAKHKLGPNFTFGKQMENNNFASNERIDEIERREEELRRKEQLLIERERRLMEGNHLNTNQTSTDRSVAKQPQATDDSSVKTDEIGGDLQNLLVEFLQVIKNQVKEKNTNSLEKEHSISSSRPPVNPPSDAYIEEQLLEDARSRNATQEIELIKKLSSSDKNALHVTTLQRKRFQASLRRLGELSAGQHNSIMESNIRDKLNNALLRLKEESYHILSKGLWSDTSVPKSHPPRNPDIKPPTNEEQRKSEESWRDTNHPFNQKPKTEFSSAPSGHNYQNQVSSQPLGNEGQHHTSASNNNQQSSSNDESDMEEKIFHSLCQGSLAPIAKAFANNPDLQAALKAWEGNQAKKDDAQACVDHPEAEHSMFEDEPHHDNPEHSGYYNAPQTDDHVEYCGPSDPIHLDRLQFEPNRKHFKSGNHSSFESAWNEEKNRQVPPKLKKIIKPMAGPPPRPILRHPRAVTRTHGSPQFRARFPSDMSPRTRHPFHGHPPRGNRPLIPNPPSGHHKRPLPPHQFSPHSSAPPRKRTLLRGKRPPLLPTPK